jgi:hypothetical protein
MSRILHLFAPRAPVGLAETRRADTPAWLSELSAPAPLARWASSFADLRPCWDACRDPEWLVWLAARTCGPGERRRLVVLCTAELASLAGRGRRDADPQVAAAITAVVHWAESGTEEDLGLLTAEWGAMDAAGQAEQVARHSAKRALALFRSLPHHRLNPVGISRALHSRQRWREADQARQLALSAAFAARAAWQADDASIMAAQWAGCASQAAGFALRAMPGRRTGRPGWRARRRCLRLARRLLPVPAGP